ncbi:hypothetical protein CW304_27700 [Bacillus sp. UFRGS-B20]|nr:hypothetical protein CW304_27700 [Bacillus sp. UFRGS-B20]
MYFFRRHRLPSWTTHCHPITLDRRWWCLLFLSACLAQIIHESRKLKNIQSENLRQVRLKKNIRSFPGFFSFFCVFFTSSSFFFFFFCSISSNVCL